MHTQWSQFVPNMSTRQPRTLKHHFIIIVRACELDAWGGDPSSEVLKRGGLHRGRLHLVVTEVVPIVVVRTTTRKDTQEKSSCAVQYFNEGLRGVWSLVLPVCNCNVLCCEVLELCWPNLSFVCWKGF